MREFKIKLMPKTAVLEHSEKSFLMGAGDIVFVVGPNGSGKSSLMYNLARQHQFTGGVERIVAQRQNYLDQDSVGMSAPESKSVNEQRKQWGDSALSRTREQNGGQRTLAALNSLIQAEHERNEKIANLVDKNDHVQARELSEKLVPPLKVISSILKRSGIPIELNLDKELGFNATKNNGKPYPIGKLSDGERNAIIIGANILTVQSGTTIMIDEPERHLHQSISAPLIAALIQERSDCSFIISTHELSLPQYFKESQVILLRECEHDPNVKKTEHDEYVSWDAEFLDKGIDIDEQTKREILGSRKRMLYVEGVPNSLDKSLYTLLFPDMSVICKGGCSEVMQAVRSINRAAPEHWVQAWGIIDKDIRENDEVEKLKSKNIFALPVCTVESIYYHPNVVEYVSSKNSKVDKNEHLEKLQKAEDKALTNFVKKKNELTQKVLASKVRKKGMSNLPNIEDDVVIEEFKYVLNVKAERDAISKDFDSLVKNRDLVGLITRYPVKDAGVLDPFIKELGFKSQAEYEKRVIECLAADEELKKIISSFFKNVMRDINAGDKGESAKNSKAIAAISPVKGLLAKAKLVKK